MDSRRYAEIFFEALIATAAFVILMFVVTCGICYAENKSPPVPLHIVNLENPTIDYRTLDRVSRRAIEYWRGYGVRLNKRKTEKRPDPFYDVRDEGMFESFHMEFISWWQTMIGEKKIKPATAVHVLAPSWSVNGKRYIAGWAWLGFIGSGAFSYSNCDMLIRDNAEGAFRYCVVAMAHELGHSVLGCEHEDGANLMNPNALYEQLLLERYNPTGRLLPLKEKCLQRVRKFNARTSR
jgi:hypothetical protein